MAIDVLTLQQNIKKGILEKLYVFCGDESLIKEGIKLIVDKSLDKNFIDLNYIKFDGNTLESFQPIINACQTLPFMSEKKVVLLFGASFLRDDGGNNNKLSSEKNFKELSSYLNQIPDHCILILTEEYKSKRDRMSKKIKSLEKKGCVVSAEKMRGQQLESKIKSFFEERAKNIGKVELRIFSSMMDDNNLSIVENEVEKLCCYTQEKDITKEDIKSLFIKQNDDDIFDLINPISQKKVKESLLVLNELLYKGEKIQYILSMIERQFNLLFKIKLFIENKKTKSEIMKELRIRSEYRCDLLIGQSKRFTLKQLQKAIEMCLNSEQKMKSSSINEKTEMELLIINTIAG